MKKMKGCPACGHDTSIDALSCTHCGCVFLMRKMRFFAPIVLGVILSVLLVSSTGLDLSERIWGTLMCILPSVLLIGWTILGFRTVTDIRRMIKEIFDGARQTVEYNEEPRSDIARQGRAGQITINRDGENFGPYSLE